VYANKLSSTEITDNLVKSWPFLGVGVLPLCDTLGQIFEFVSPTAWFFGSKCTIKRLARRVLREPAAELTSLPDFLAGFRGGTGIPGGWREGWERKRGRSGSGKLSQTDRRCWLLNMKIMAPTDIASNIRSITIINIRCHSDYKFMLDSTTYKQCMIQYQSCSYSIRHDSNASVLQQLVAVA